MTYVHETLQLKFGKDETYLALMNQLLPLLAPLGWTLVSTYRFGTGVARMWLNIWQIPDANTFAALGGHIVANPELGKVLADIEACLDGNVLALMDAVSLGA